MTLGKCKKKIIIFNKNNYYLNKKLEKLMTTLLMVKFKYFISYYKKLAANQLPYSLPSLAYFNVKETNMKKLITSPSHQLLLTISPGHQPISFM